MSPFPQPSQSLESPPPKSRSRRAKLSVRRSARRPRRERKAARWTPRSEKAQLRRLLRQTGLPNPTDRLRALRLLRSHPSALFRILDHPESSAIMARRMNSSLRPSSFMASMRDIKNAAASRTPDGRWTSDVGRPSPEFMAHRKSRNPVLGLATAGCVRAGAGEGPRFRCLGRVSGTARLGDFGATLMPASGRSDWGARSAVGAAGAGLSRFAASTVLPFFRAAAAARTASPKALRAAICFSEGGFRGFAAAGETGSSGICPRILRHRPVLSKGYRSLIEGLR